MSEPRQVLLGCEIEERDACGARGTLGIKQQIVRGFDRKDLGNGAAWKT